MCSARAAGAGPGSARLDRHAGMRQQPRRRDEPRGVRAARRRPRAVLLGPPAVRCSAAGAVQQTLLARVASGPQILLHAARLASAGAAHVRRPLTLCMLRPVRWGRVPAAPHAQLAAPAGGVRAGARGAGGLPRGGGGAQRLAQWREEGGRGVSARAAGTWVGYRRVEPRARRQRRQGRSLRLHARARLSRQQRAAAPARGGTQGTHWQSGTCQAAP